MSIDSDRQILDFEELGLRDNAKDLCGSLVEAEKGPDGDVTLVHATAKGFVSSLSKKGLKNTDCLPGFS